MYGTRGGQNERLTRDLLITSYKLRAAEVSRIQGFELQTATLSVTAVAGVILYAVSSRRPEVAALLPPVVCLSGVALFALLSDLASQGCHMAKIELVFAPEGADCFNWELKHGAMSEDKALRLSTVVLLFIGSVLFFVPYCLTAADALISPQVNLLRFASKGDVRFRRNKLPARVFEHKGITLSCKVQ